MPLTIPVAHDFVCPWCWVGWIQSQRLRAELGVRFDWVGYELWPAELPRPAPGVPVPKDARRPVTPSRFDFLLTIEGLTLPDVPQPSGVDTHAAHEAVEYAKTEGAQEAAMEALYRAFWERGEHIGDPETVIALVGPHVSDVSALRKAIESRQFADNIVGFDDPAHENGVFNVPTFFIGSERYAEQPYNVLCSAIQAELAAAVLYRPLSFAPQPSDRPLTMINMVTTIDGKILSGERSESVIDLGSKFDHEVMRRIEEQSDCVIVGAQTLRATPKTWSPRTRHRVVVTASGNVPADHSFLCEGAPIVAHTSGARLALGSGVSLWNMGSGSADLDALLRRLFTERDIRRILILGGSELNAAFLERDLVDELFWTVAPKVKLGRDIPTYADGTPLPKDKMLHFELVTHTAVGNELFVRYRRKK
jgi:riboflavin biosynthesis pyrimidine reductase/predicted DsbA family dithiol-disulfide isomerase